MKCEVIVDALAEEKVVIYTKERNALVEELVALAKRESAELYGYRDEEIVKLDVADVQCISVIGNKVYAICERDRYLLKERLYVLEARLPDTFVKINQSCLANIAHMERFDTSISGTLKIRFRNGHVDYVSRRQLKLIKERIGI